MGLICIETATGAVREWVRHGQPAAYDPAVHVLIEQDVPPPVGARWDGQAFVPAAKKKMQRDLDTEDALAKIDLVSADVAIPRPVREALAAIRKVLG